MDFMTLALIALAILVFLGLFALLYALLNRGINLRERVRPTGAVEERSDLDERDAYYERLEKVFKPLGQMIPRSPEDLGREERRLMQAGIRRREGALILYGVRLALAGGILILTAFTGYLYAYPYLCLPLAILLGAALPDIWLSSRISERKDKLQLALPDVMDLSVVCVEAGLGMDQALLRIGQEIGETHPEISEELRIYSLEINAGRSRSDALRNLAGRTDVDDLKALVAVLIQADRFGTSIAQSLRIFSENLRTKRRQRAEERAAKITVKMIPPLVIFVFPAIFVVVAGPAIIQIAQQLLPLMGGEGP